jgi:hypothetical protein
MADPTDLLVVLLRLKEDAASQVERFCDALSARSGVTLANPKHYRLMLKQQLPGPHPFGHVMLVRHPPTDCDLAKLVDELAASLESLEHHAAADYVPLNAAVRTQDEPTAIQLSFTSALPGRSAEFEAWYETYHFPDGLRLPGFAGGQRFRRKESAAAHKIPMTVLASYQLDTTDVGPTIKAIAERAGTPAFRLTDSMDPEYWAWFFQPLKP